MSSRIPGSPVGLGWPAASSCREPGEADPAPTTTIRRLDSTDAGVAEVRGVGLGWVGDGLLPRFQPGQGSGWAQVER